MENRRQSQADKILALLEEANHRSGVWGDGWVTLPQILSLRIASHSRRIFELRKTHAIEMRDEYVNGERRTAYRLVKA